MESSEGVPAYATVLLVLCGGGILVLLAFLLRKALALLGRCRAGEELVVSGKIVLNRTTDASLLKLFIAR